jgi:hypothetical protein
MNLFITIFGGMLLTAVLYGLGRLGRLSNFWAAVIAAALPSAAYMVYGLMQWPGLDVITIHLVAYPTVALLFGLLYGTKANHSLNMHWIPKLLIGFFVALTLVMGAFVYIARQGLPPNLAAMLLPDTHGQVIHTGFAGVVEHNQEAANGIAHHLEMQNKLMKRGWQLEVSGLDGIRPGISTPVNVLISDRETRPVENLTVNLELLHPGQRGEIQLPLTGGLGGYHGMVPSLDAGHWVARITLAKTDGETIDLEHDIDVR